MGDVGDYWREHRNYKRAVRSFWHECPTCAVAYGTGTKVAPGTACRNCGWVAPGEVGSDKARALSKLEQDAADEEARQIEKEAKRKRKLALRTCKVCGKVLKNERARIDHMKDKHGGVVQ